MPQITFKETVTKKIEISLDTLYKVIDNLTDRERKKFIDRLNAKPIKMESFKKDNIESILADFEATDMYEADFLKDLEGGLKKSSIFK